MLIQRVPRIRSGRIGRAGKDIRMLADNDDIRSVTSSSSFRMIGVYRSAFEGGDGTLNETRFVEGICVDVDLHSTKGAARTHRQSRV